MTSGSLGEGLVYMTCVVARDKARHSGAQGRLGLIGTSPIRKPYLDFEATREQKVETFISYWFL